MLEGLLFSVLRGTYMVAKMQMIHAWVIAVKAIVHRKFFLV